MNDWDAISRDVAADDSWRATVDQRYRDHLTEKLEQFCGQIGIPASFLAEVEQSIERGTAGLDLAKVETMLRLKSARADQAA